MHSDELPLKLPPYAAIEFRLLLLSLLLICLYMLAAHNENTLSIC